MADASVPASEDDLIAALIEGGRAAFLDLFGGYSEQHFYYCALITTGEGHAPEVCAWSREALEVAAQGDSDARSELKWSYADSPFYGFGSEHLQRAKELWETRPHLDWNHPDEYEAEVSLRLRAMERALRALDSEGIFGAGAGRTRLVINAEVMPPDHDNVARAKRLNPPEALEAWLVEAAEPE